VPIVAGSRVASPVMVAPKVPPPPPGGNYTDPYTVTLKDTSNTLTATSSLVIERNVDPPGTRPQPPSEEPSACSREGGGSRDRYGEERRVGA
jgi:hypothetical protein